MNKKGIENRGRSNKGKSDVRGKGMEASLRNNPFLGLWSKACSSTSKAGWAFE